jgi:hypothetical protein
MKTRCFGVKPLSSLLLSENFVAVEGGQRLRSAERLRVAGKHGQALSLFAHWLRRWPQMACGLS